MKIVKILLWIVGVFVLLFAAFVGNGMINHTIEYDNEVTVDKSVIETWLVMGDTSKMKDWLPGFKKTEHVSGIPQTVGAVSNIYVEENGQEGVIKETITKVVPLQSLGMDFDSDFMKMEYEVSTEVVEGKTVIKSHSVVRGTNLIFKGLFALMPSELEKQEQTNLENLKKVIEEFSFSTPLNSAD